MALRGLDVQGGGCLVGLLWVTDVGAKTCEVSRDTVGEREEVHGRDILVPSRNRIESDVTSTWRAWGRWQGGGC